MNFVENIEKKVFNSDLEKIRNIILTETQAHNKQTMYQRDVWQLTAVFPGAVNNWHFVVCTQFFQLL